MFRFFFAIFAIASFSSIASGASFDCSKARTAVEKKICSSEELSALDDVLGAKYKETKTALPIGADWSIDESQFEWLKQRDKCRTIDCLVAKYKERIKELSKPDPLADKSVSCEEMRSVPERVFIGLDLGTGHGSPIAVDYGCQESLASLDFLADLYGLAETIRSENGPQICTGSIIHAHWRYYRFGLLRAGFYPRSLLTDNRGDEYKGVLQYFEQWSWASPYNHALYLSFMEKFAKAEPRMAAYYQEKFHMGSADANKAARRALMLFVDRAAGTYPSSAIKTKTPLIELASSETEDFSELKKQITLMVADSTSKQDAYEALKAALYTKKSEAFVRELLSYIGRIDHAEVRGGDESALFAALDSPAYVKMLIEAGEPVDYENWFGKTPLFYAIQFNEHDTAALLIKNGADVNHPYKSAAELSDPCKTLVHTRRTPLMHAAQNSDKAMLGLLISNGARLNEKDDILFSALDYAVMGKNDENESYLISMGAKSRRPNYPKDVAGRPLPLSAPLGNGEIAFDGVLKKLVRSPNRSDILVVAVEPWDSVKPGEAQGIFILSISDPKTPSIVSHIPFVRAADMALSADGKSLYVLHTHYTGASEDLPYGMLAYDIGDVKRPTLKNHVDGDFMTMQLSRDGAYIYLQERKLKPEMSRGLLVYGVSDSEIKQMCSRRFHGPDGGEYFAYRFSEFSDKPMLAIYDRLRKIAIFDVSEPCSPILLNEVDGEKIGINYVAYRNGIIVSESHGVASQRIVENIENLSGWGGDAEWMSFNRTSGVVVVSFGGEVGLASVNGESGEISPLSRYDLVHERSYSAVFTNVGWLYVGYRNALRSYKVGQ